MTVCNLVINVSEELIASVFRVSICKAIRVITQKTTIQIFTAVKTESHKMS
jgi:hypothetical protein